MNQFNQQIQRAAARQRRFYVVAFLVVAVLGTAVGAFAFLLKGSPIRVGPDEIAETAEIDVIDGIAVLVDSTLFSLSRSPHIKVSAAGFETARLVLLPDMEGKPVQVKLKELPGHLTLSTSVGQSDIQWRIDDKPAAVAANLEADLPAGSYRVRAVHPFFKPVEKDYTLARGQTIEEVLPLVPVQGSLDLQSSPPGAVVGVNNDEKQNTPARISVPGGVYTVSVSLPGFIPVSEEIRITNKHPDIQRHYKMKPLPAYVSISAVPKGGLLTLSGKTVTAGSKIPLSGSKPYYVRYEKPGYFPQEKKLTVAPGKEATLVFELKAEIGEVNISSQPKAAVFLNGQLAGETPLKLRLPARRHKMEIRRSGYRTYVKKIKPSSKSPLNLSVTLKTEKQARIAEASKRYRNTVNMNMLLFKPGTVDLGAPRHEKGQRANEFMRHVRFSRYFYVSQDEVSEKQFSDFKSGKYGSSPTLPVSGVSWIDAAAYCNWLSEKEGLKPFYRILNGRYRGYDSTSNGYRLPSEAEWEWLARKAGRKDQARFPWGNETVIPVGAGNIADETANGTTRFFVSNYVDGFAGVAPIGSFSQDKAGLHDIFGNVSEWVHDVYSLIPPAKGTVFTDPLGAQTGDKHVIKGASWSSGTLTEIRPSYRNAGNGAVKNVGFRVARYL